ncbi:MAG TPA: DNA repair protein RecN, partial [Chthoniobacteraceae bacterium]|nr:DNA repair protein RecN [Chthoniobacteraceae bacterium]
MAALLSSLRIQNLALVEELEWTLPRGAIAVTGETGSGKSIIIGALKLLLGERADKSLIRTGAESCMVEAVFTLDNVGELNAQLAENGLDPCEGNELILKRVFSLAGANRQFINCSATTLAVLKVTGDGLVDLHGPHDHQSLLSPVTQLGLLDAFAGTAPQLDEYEACYNLLNKLNAERDALTGGEGVLEREVELLKHQIAEIEGAAIQPGEEAPLLARYTTGTNARRLTELSTQILQQLEEADDAALTRLCEIQRTLHELEKIDPATAGIALTHAEAIGMLEDAARALQRYAQGLDIDAAELARIEERVSLFETLKRKYGGTLEAVAAFGESAAERLRKIESRGTELVRLGKEIEAANRALREAGQKLGKKRAAAAPKLAKDITSQLLDLGFKKSGFEIALAPLPKPGPFGLDGVEFLFSPNPGEPMKPLKAIASSGEISRVMLAVKTSLAAQDTIPLLVFDEIDANVGGEIAHAVGGKMKALGEAHQVICITHLPQVAAVAGAQFVVSKDVRDGR